MMEDDQRLVMMECEDDTLLLGTFYHIQHNNYN